MLFRSDQLVRPELLGGPLQKLEEEHRGGFQVDVGVTAGNVDGRQVLGPVAGAEVAQVGHQEGDARVLGGDQVEVGDLLGVVEDRYAELGP